MPDKDDARNDCLEKSCRERDDGRKTCGEETTDEDDEEGGGRNEEPSGPRRSR